MQNELNAAAAAQLVALAKRANHVHIDMPPDALDDVLEALRDLAVAADRAVRTLNAYHATTGRHGRLKRLTEMTLASFSIHRIEVFEPDEPFSDLFHRLLQERRKSP